ncbi:hypothetical protein [Streptomyces sp. NPDC046832]|uniref:hypothetical protein n=1 Tax=Streptomyces sp. NPDC046832 TaxID=3155020 RepID=UPI0034077A3A
MADGTRRLTGPMLAAAALAAVLGFPARPSQPAEPAPDFTTALSGRTAGAAALSNLVVTAEPVESGRAQWPT